MKKLTALLLSLLMLLSLNTGFAGETSPINIGGLKGPTTMGLVKLLSDNKNNKTPIPYNFTMATTADELIPRLLQGEFDLLSVPANLASVLYNKSEGKVKVVAVGVLGVLYIVEKGDSVQSLEDLKGKTLYATGKNTTPEYALRTILSANGIDFDKDLTIEWVSEPTEAVAKLSQQEGGIAMLPQPFVTVAQKQVEGLRVALSLEEEWNKQENAGRLVTAVALAHENFVNARPDALAQFLKDYEASVAFANEQVEEAALLVEEYGIVKAPIAKEALPYTNLVCITGIEMKTALEGYLSVLFAHNPAAVGGEMPGEDFYYLAK